MRFDPVDAHYAKAIQRANWEQSVAILEEAGKRRPNQTEGRRMEKATATAKERSFNIIVF